MDQSSQIFFQEDKDEAGLYIVKYIPEEVGHTAIHVFWNDVEIPGSPFTARICDSTAVKPVGGWESVLDRETGRMEMIIGRVFGSDSSSS